MRIFLALGTNLGDREMNLVTVRDLLMKYDVLVVGQSEVRETEPLGGLDQPKYLNQVVECRTELSPEVLLAVCKKVEVEMGRPAREAGGRAVLTAGNVRFGMGVESVGAKEDWDSRVIDVDILFYGNQVIQSSLLKIPHPGIVERDFVIQGLCDLDSDFEHPVLKKRMKDLLFGA